MGGSSFPVTPKRWRLCGSGSALHAIRVGLADLDTAAIRDGRPRALTQAISQWINTLTDPDGEAVAGIQFDWAVIEWCDLAALGRLNAQAAPPLSAITRVGSRDP